MTPSAVNMTGSVLPKWQLALAVGAPVALGLGYMYYKNSNKPKSPKSTRGKSRGSSKENGTPAADKQISIDVDCPPNTTPETETLLEKALRFKNEGNYYFKMGTYDEAINQYNNAIETCPKENTEELATFYQNRAAAYEHLKKYNAVKEDCTKALELNPQYTKALLRRARVLERSKDLESALEDVTASCILENFSNQTSLEMADRVLKQLGKQHATDYLKNKKVYIMPSKQVIKNYMNYFHNDPVFTLLRNSDNSNLSPGFVNILDYLRKEEYDNIIPLCTKAIEDPESDTLPYKMELLLLRASFSLLLGQHDNAINDFITIIDSQNVSTDIKVNALVKRANVYMYLENLEKCFNDFESAIKLDPNNGDIYMHKGLVNLLVEKPEEAKEDFTKAVELNPDFANAYVQKCYTDFHYGAIMRDTKLSGDAIQDFNKAFEKFPNFSDCYFLFAQILSDMQKYQEADSYLSKALAIDPNNTAILAHKGLLQLKWHGDVNKAVEYINQALELDNKCEFAYETLATIEVQRGNLEKALTLFDELLMLSRTLTELTHIFSLRDSVKTQLRLQEKLGPDIMLRSVS